MIFDLFCSIDASVNDGIPSKYEKINYKPLEKAIKLIIKVNHEIMMIKYDLKIIFHYILISSVDYWLLIFQWNDKFYIDLFLSFNLRIVSRIFNLFFEVFHWVFELLLYWDLTHYLNDFLFIFSSDIELKNLAK